MDNYYWGTSSSSTWTTNDYPKEIDEILLPLKKPVKKYKTVVKAEKKVGPVLFDPKELDL